MLDKCMYGGGVSCVCQGGDGSLHHSNTYFHPYPTVEEAGYPVGDFIQKAHSIEETHLLEDFVINFDEDSASSILSLELSKGIDINDLIKSLYDFDLETEEGIRKLLGLVPVLDSAIIVDLVEKIWPGYAVEQEDPDLLRGEIIGYFLDYLKE